MVRATSDGGSARRAIALVEDQEIAGDVRMKQIPLIVLVSAFSIFLVGVRDVNLGPVSPKGALTIIVAFLTVLFLPVYASTAAQQARSYGPEGTRTNRLPALAWTFLFCLLASTIFTMTRDGIHPDVVQQVCVYVSFIGAVAFASTVQSADLATRSWEFLRSAAVVFGYLSLAASLLDIGPFGLSEPGPARATVIVGLVALALVIPGKPQNIWIKLAPIALVATAALSLSRTATVIGLAMLLFLFLRNAASNDGKVGGRLWRIAPPIVIVGVAAYVLTNYYTAFGNRFVGGDKGFAFGDTTISTQGRTAMWQLVFDRANGTLLGNGPGSASRLINEHFPGLGHPHNEYLRLYYDFGLIGATLFFGAYALLTWQVLRSARKSNNPLHWSAVMGLGAIALVAVTDNPFVYFNVMLPLGSLVGLSLAVASYEDRSRRAPHTTAAISRSKSSPSRSGPTSTAV
ncbi:O-antigen ligase [Mycobacterium sp. PSTR-4-N]|uniref:O-antigen ligase family protein n=1 Tax=Mycobacterium sp. PSTR-4-N TaxID=2917745 RepID=UPI001F14B60A|nr:O-antigen ligase family protein [Mycobacterium sp. PSTR-4-N]MCG7592781.1 O-antigen ligase family protein [Mycobacterium sp. PSTR-4-N]